MVKKNSIKEINGMKRIIVRILKKHGIKKAGIFGSYVRGEQKKGSDIDVLVEIPKVKNFSLLDFAEIKLELQDSLKMKVDLVEYKMIKPIIKEQILKEEIRII